MRFRGSYDSQDLTARSASTVALSPDSAAACRAVTPPVAARLASALCAASSFMISALPAPV